MKEELYKYIVSQSGALSVKEIIVCFMAAVVIGAIIFVSYRFSHTASVYSAKFNVSLIMLVLVTTLVMSVIGNNVALSLGMVGALSIVRFRTAIKDPRDTAYIFWCVAAGICCGIGDYMIAGIGTGVIFIVMLLFGNIRNNDRYLLIVRGNGEVENVESTIDKYFNNKAFFRVCNEDRNMTEYIYEVSYNCLQKAKKNAGDKNIKSVLFEIDGVEAVNLVCQNDEITR
ncbi:MAG: DUF4956 domain-containing protein [Lachnospiraceae bacterium]|nr:DUF4956 domain-containing protein [Lachnospiraceae bacterium]